MKVLIENAIQTNGDLQDLTLNHIDKITNYEITKGITVSLSLFSGEIEDITKQHEEAKGVPVARMMGFPEFISPSDMRNDIYLTLGTANFRMNESLIEGLRTKNITVETRVMIDGEDDLAPRQLTKCFKPAVSVHGDQVVEDYYTAAVHYHVKNPNWNETVKVDIDPKYMERAIFVFVFKTVSSSKGCHTLMF